MFLIYGVTCDHTTNYGSCLQAYALKTAIEKISIDGVACSYLLIPASKLKDYPEKRKLRNRLNSLIIKPFMAIHKLEFREFNNNHLKYSDIKSCYDLPGLNQTADAFVCGSDVIWNQDINRNRTIFWLDFARKYKFSYAASFGKSGISEDYKRVASKYLKTFDSVSVRELYAVDLIKQISGVEAVRVLDPVFLLGLDDWNQFMEKENKHSEKGYIFVYNTHLNDEIKKFIKALKAKTGLKVEIATAGAKQALKQGMLGVPSPEKWLRLLKNAEYVVTNSFHATAFSVMFHKKFFTVVHGERNKGINIRMYEFLRSIGLEDRIYSGVPAELEMSEIDFTEADKTIQELKKISLQFLYDNLKNAYKRKTEINT